MREEWAEAIKASDVAYKEMIEAMNSNDIKRIMAAKGKYDSLEDERERATIRAGHFPAWPPRTDEGLASVGLTREQVNKILAQNVGRNWSAS